MKAVIFACLAAEAMIVGGALGWQAVRASDQALRITVVDAADPAGTSRWTLITVNVTNPGPAAVTPVFTVPANPLQNWYTWSIVSGPTRLAAGARAEFAIAQPPFTAPRSSDGFRVLVRAMHDDRIIGLSDVRAPAPPTDVPAVTNPQFRDWTPSMFAPDNLPFGWVRFVRARDVDSHTITGADGRVTLTLTTGGDVTLGEAPMVALRQRAGFPAPLVITFGSDAPDPSLGVGGVLIDDYGQKKRVMVLHTQDGEIPPAVTAWLAQSGREWDATVAVPDRDGEVNLIQLFQDRGWNVPAPRYVPSLVDSTQGAVGFGVPSSSFVLSKYVVQRPIELKVFLLALPNEDPATLTFTVHEVGGPALDFEEVVSR